MGGIFDTVSFPGGISDTRSVPEVGYVQGVVMSWGWVPTPTSHLPSDMGYHGIRLVSEWLIRWIRWSQKVEGDTMRTRSEFENELNENKVQSARKGLCYI